MQNAELFDLPTSEGLAEIQRDLRLTDVQARELHIAIRHARDDLNDYFRDRIGRKKRKAGMDRLKDIDKALEKLIRLLGRNPDVSNDILPFNAREAIGWCASSELIENVTGELATRDGVRTADREESVGLRHGSRLLAAQLRLIRDPIKVVLAEKSTDLGGPEPDHVRLVLIRTLAEAAPDIIGQAATPAEGGPFIKLVAEVFGALNLKDKGLVEAVERVLYLSNFPKPSVN